MFSKKPEQMYPSEALRPMTNGSTFSVIGADVAIKGNVEASADLHVDGSVEGDIVCTSLVPGESSRVEGSITADGARLAGTLKGTITVRELVVLKTARIDGDVHYETLTIEQGATVNGRFAPDAGKASPKTATASVPEQRPNPMIDLAPRGEDEPLKFAN